MDRETEIVLVRRLRAGDTAAFDATYAAYHARLFNFLVRLSRRRELAEDLVEETWLRLVSKRAELREDTHLAAWLFTVARNLYTTHCRTRMVEEAHRPALADLWPAGVHGPSPFERTAASELDRQLELALDDLPHSYREILLLIGVEGLTPSEAAIVCGLSPEAARQRLSRARALLAERLAEPRAKRPALLRVVLS